MNKKGRMEELIKSDPQNKKEVLELLEREYALDPAVNIILNEIDREDSTLIGCLVALVAHHADERIKLRDSALRNAIPPSGPLDVEVDITGLMAELKTAARDLEEASMVIANLRMNDDYKKSLAAADRVKAIIRKNDGNTDASSF